MRPPARDRDGDDNNPAASSDNSDEQIEEADEGMIFGEGGEDEMIEMGEGGEDEMVVDEHGGEEGEIEANEDN